MKIPARRCVLLLVAVASIIHPASLRGQEDAPDDPMPELLNQLGQIESRIGFLQARFDVAVGEDRELFGDQLLRRWAEHHDLLGEMAAATEAMREAGAERVDATERMRLALQREVEFVRAYYEILRERVAELRRIRPDTPPEGLAAIEFQLTDLNLRIDGLIVAATDDVERAEVVGLDLGPRVGLFDSALAERAALIAARIELATDQRTRLLERAGRAGADSVAIQEELNALEEKLFGTTASLQTMVDLLDRRGMTTSEYRRLVLETTGNLGTNILDPEVVGGLVVDRWAAAGEWIGEHAGTMLVRLLTIVAVLFVFGILAGLGRRAAKRVLSSSRVDTSELLKRLLVGTASKLVWLIGFLVVLSVVGVDIGPALAGLGIAGFVIGFALQDTLSNFASGLMIMVYRPFDVGDLVKAAGVTGTVKAVTLVSTVITTLDNQVMIVPNNKVWGDVINNVTAQETRRVDLVFGISYTDDIEKARAIMNDVVRSHDLVLDDPEPVIRVHSLGESSVDFVCRPWCRTDDYWDVHWDVIETVKKRFDAEGVSIPFPQRDVHFYNHGEEAEAGAGAGPAA
jgi:small conductance mechanosensitive channel